MTIESRHLTPGVYAPLPTFFDEEEEIDFESYGDHLLNLASNKIMRVTYAAREIEEKMRRNSYITTVPVCLGSLGEAVHLSHEERIEVIRFTRKTLDSHGLQKTPIVAGVGGSCTRETIKLANDAADAGADAGMVILPAYYAASLNTDRRQVIQYYVDICQGSPIPILLYNFPANSAGQDMSSDTIATIMGQAPKLCGVKLTCGGSMGKLVRLNSLISSDASINDSRPFPFLLLDGLVADLKPWTQCGGHGTVSGLSNFAPRAMARLWHLLTLQNPLPEQVAELDRIQTVLSKADVAAVPAGVRGMKYALHRLKNYGINPRRPMLPLNQSEGEDFMTTLHEVLQLEASLEAAGKSKLF